MSKDKSTPDRASKLLLLISSSLSKLDDDSFTSRSLNKSLSKLLLSESKKLALSNEEVFGMLRLAVTGEKSPHGGAPKVGEIAEIMGREEVLKRLKEAQEEVQKIV